MHESISMNSYIWILVIFTVVLCGLILLSGKILGDSDTPSKGEPPPSESPENKKQ